MNRGLLISNVILFILTGILFYLHFSNCKKTEAKPVINKTATPEKQVKIAYFEMDSLESSFSMVKDVKTELGKREDAISNELARMEKNYRDKATMYQKQAEASAMTQAQSEKATQEMMQLQENNVNRKKSMEQEYQDLYMRKMRDVRTKIEDYLKEYNQSKGYTYIIVNEPGIFYYRDTVYNITKELLVGLNERYSKKK